MWSSRAFSSFKDSRILFFHLPSGYSYSKWSLHLLICNCIDGPHLLIKVLNCSAVQFSSVQFSRSAMSDSLRHHEPQHTRPPCSSSAPGVHPNSCPMSPPKPMSIQLSHLLSSPSPPASTFPSIRVFSNESALHMRWPKYWSFSFSISPSNKHPGLISFRMDWLDLLAVQGTLKSLLQYHRCGVLLWALLFSNIPSPTKVPKVGVVVGKLHYVL